MATTAQTKSRGRLRRAWDELVSKARIPGPGGVGFAGEFPDIATYNYDYLESFYKTNPWVNRAVKAISESIAALPLRLYREKRAKSGKIEREEVFDHEALALLDRPNPMQSQSELIRALVSNRALSGESWLYTDDGTAGQGDRPGTPIQLRSMRSMTIAPIPGKIELIKGYRYQGESGGTTVIRPHYIAGLRSWNPESDYRGLPPMEVAKRPALLQWYMTAHNTRFFQKGGYVGLYLTSPNVINKESRDSIEATLNKRYSGVDSRGGIPVVDNGAEFKNAIENAKDGDFINLDALAREQVLAVYGTPPVACGILDDASYANAWQQMKMFYQLTVAPLCDELTDALNHSWLYVFWPDEKGLYLQFDLSGVQWLGDDALTQSQVNASDVRVGIKTINEVRREKDLPPVDYGDDPPASVSGFGLGLGLSGGKESDIRRSGVDWVSKSTFDLRRARQKEVDRRIQSDVPLMSKFMIGYWTGQEARIIEALNKYGSKSGHIPTGTVEAIIETGMLPQVATVRKIDSGDLQGIFDYEYEAELLRKSAAPLIEKVVARVAKQSLIDIGSDVVFNVQDPRVTVFLANKTFQMARDVNAYTQHVIHEILIDATLDNSTVDQVASRIRSSFEEFERYRALRVARTEMAAAHNGGAIEAYDQGGVAGKGWASVIDDVTRESHIELDGMEIPLRDDFVTDDGHHLQAPGIGGAGSDVGDVVNCRCAVYAVAELT